MGRGKVHPDGPYEGVFYIGNGYLHCIFVHIHLVSQNFCTNDRILCKVLRSASTDHE